MPAEQATYIDKDGFATYYLAMQELLRDVGFAKEVGCYLRHTTDPVYMSMSVVDVRNGDTVIVRYNVGR